jgi:hypothetical protein
MNHLDLVFFRRLREKIEEEKQNRMQFIANGTANSFDEYKYGVGYLRSLSDVLIWAKEVNDELTGNN